MARLFINSVIKRMEEIEKKGVSAITAEEADELFVKTFSSIQSTIHILSEISKDFDQDVAHQLKMIALSLNNLFKLYFKGEDAVSRSVEASEIIILILRDMANPPTIDMSVDPNEYTN